MHVAVGDVAGHGLGAALVMALTRAYVRSFCGQGLGVGKILSGVNRMLRADLEESRYVTLAMVNIDLAEGVLSYGNAGHVPGFVMSPSGEIETLMGSTGMPLGLFAGQRIGTKMLPLQSGQVIALLTDGVTEAGVPAEFGAERVIEYVREWRAAPAQQIAEGLYQAARSFAKDQPQEDDITIVILKIE